MSSDIREALTKYADDVELKIAELQEHRIVLSVSLPSRGGETWLIRSDDVVHLDMSPCITLGRVEFGSMLLLPSSYIDTRELDYGGEADRYRVLRFINVDDKIGYLILYGEEEIVREGVG